MTTASLAPIPKPIIATLVAAALAEDLGLIGDITTEATIPAGRQATCVLAGREAGVLAGLDVAAATFHHLNPHI